MRLDLWRLGQRMAFVPAMRRTHPAASPLQPEQGRRGGASGVTIEAGAYLAFPADGERPAAIIDAWKDVWAYFSTDRRHERSYETDFEEYSGPASATIYIGVNARS